MKRSETDWYKVVKTGKMIRAKEVVLGIFRDVHHGDVYFDDEITYVGERNVRKSMFGFGRFGVFLKYRSYYGKRKWFLLPCLIISYENGNDWYVQAEIRFLFFGVSARIIFLKSKNAVEMRKK